MIETHHRAACFAGAIHMRSMHPTRSMQTDNHALKSTDELIIDVTGMSPEHYKLFEDHISAAESALNARNKELRLIWWIGEQ